MQELKRKHMVLDNLIISNEEMNNIMKIVQTLEDSNISLKGITKTIEKETNKKKKGGFLRMFLGTLGTSFLGNMLTGKGILRVVYGNKEGKRMLKADYRSKDPQVKKRFDSTI